MAGSEESDAMGAPEVFQTADRKPAGRGRSKIRSALRYFLYFAVVFAAGTGAGWYYVGTQFLTGDGSGIPLIKADKGPVKVRPISPGGMEVPDRDKLVYDRMQGNGERPRVERLLPAPETPLPPPGRDLPRQMEAAAPAPDSAKDLAAAAPAPDSAKDLAAVAPAAGPVTPPPAKAGTSRAPTVGSGPSAAPGSAAATPTVEEVLAAVRPPSAPSPPAPKTPAKGAGKAPPAYRVQLAAVRSLERAQGEWDRLRRKNTDLLGKLALSVVKADLGPKKGVFYRLRAGPLADEAAARALCAKLASRKVGCLIVRPGR
ncbi:MAG: SPOR domain-containing protein [Proteobacteria bacterium]|nr:SPOR domain-containing protein [Pseudomonadota bacterium]